MRHASYALWPQTQCQADIQDQMIPQPPAAAAQTRICQQWAWVPGHHPHSPELGHSSALPLWDYPLSEPTIHQDHANSAEAQCPTSSLLRPRHQDSAGAATAPWSYEMHGRTGDLWLRPSVLLHQRHLSGQRKGCTIFKGNGPRISTTMKPPLVEHQRPSPRASPPLPGRLPAGSAARGGPQARGWGTGRRSPPAPRRQGLVSALLAGE